MTLNQRYERPSSKHSKEGAFKDGVSALIDNV